MKYKLIDRHKREAEILKAAAPLGDFIMVDLAKVLNCDPSALSPYIHKMKEKGAIKILGHTYIKDKSGQAQLKNVYRLQSTT